MVFEVDNFDCMGTETVPLCHQWSKELGVVAGR